MQLYKLSTHIVFLKSKHFWQPAARTASSCHQWHWVNHNTFESCVSVYAEKIYHQRKHLWKDFFGPLFPSPSIIIIFLLPKVPKVHNISQGFVHFYLSTFTCCCHPHASNYLLKKKYFFFPGPNKFWLLFTLPAFTCSCHPYAGDHLLKKYIYHLSKATKVHFTSQKAFGHFLRCPPLPAVAIPMRVIILPHWTGEPLPPFIAAAHWRRENSLQIRTVQNILSQLWVSFWQTNCARNMQN